MAKIAAGGDREVARWRRPYGAELVLTAKGRLLDKWTAGAGFTVRRRNTTLADADALARQLGGFERV